MKSLVKVFVVILSMLLVSGCSNKTTKERYDAVEFEYNGHSYIEFIQHSWKATDIIGVVHNPDCECYNIKQLY